MNPNLTEIIQGAIALVLIVGDLVLTALGRPVPTFVDGAIVSLIAFFLGAKVSSATSTAAVTAASKVASAASAPANIKQTGGA